MKKSMPNFFKYGLYPPQLVFFEIQNYKIINFQESIIIGEKL